MKLLWHPDDFEDDSTIKPTVFRREELSGDPGAHVSVDRADISQRTTMEAIAERQAAKAQGHSGLRREMSLIGRLKCEDVRCAEIDGTRAFAVDPQPIPDNPAHCGIRYLRTNGKPDAGLLLELRTKLAVLASPAVTFDEAYVAIISE